MRDHVIYEQTYIQFEKGTREQMPLMLYCGSKPTGSGPRGQNALGKSQALTLHRCTPCIHSCHNAMAKDRSCPAPPDV